MRTLISATIVLTTACGSAGSADYERVCASLGSQTFVQGALTTTGISSDLALDGPGFLVLADERGTWFSRTGAFTIGESGAFEQLATGARLQKLGGGDLTLENAFNSAGATANITLKGNLDADAPIQVFDCADPANTSSAQATVTIYDANGKAYSVDVYWAKVAIGTWEFHAMTDGGSLAAGTLGIPFEIASGTVRFETVGLIAVTQASNFEPTSGVQPLTFDLGMGLSGMTQLRAPSATTFADRDGFPVGQLSSFEVNSRGHVIGEYTNGQRLEIGVIATAFFAAPQALVHFGDGLFLPTISSGSPVIGQAGDGVRPAIIAGALEQPAYVCTAGF